MKKIVTLFTLCALFVLSVCAQNRLQTATRPASAPQLVPDRTSSWISWSEEANLTSGIVNDDDTNPFDLMCMQRFSTSDLAQYDGFSLTKVSFYLWSSSSYPAGGSYTIRVYQGGSYTSGTSMNPGTLVTSQAVSSITYDNWTNVTLNTPVTIDATQELWFGVYISNGTGLLMSYDEVNTTTGKGTIYYDTEDQAWYDINSLGLSFTVGNFGIKGYAEDPNATGIVIDLGSMFMDDINNQNYITDLTVPYGSDFTTVPVVWNFNYNEAVNDFSGSLHFEYTLDGNLISAEDISGSIPSGDWVYLNDGYNDYITVYTAAEIASGNLYGTHTFCMSVQPESGWYENDASDNTGCLTVTFEGPTQTNYSITVVNTDNTVSPSGTVTVAQGASQTFNITPGSCNTISDVLVDGSSVLSQVVNNSYTFTNVTANHTFQVIYNTTYFALTAHTDGNGSVTPTNVASAACGSSQTFTITPNSGYVIDYVTDNTVDVTASVVNNVYTLSNIQLNHDIYVAFVESTTPTVTYTVTATTDGNGTVTPANATVNAGDNLSLTITANTGYVIDYVTDNTMDVTTSVVNNVYTLNNIQLNHTIFVAFVESTTPPTATFTVTATTDGNATVTPATSTVNAGDNLSITITPNSGYIISTVTDNGADVTNQVNNSVYTLTNIVANHDVQVTCTQQGGTAVTDFALNSVKIFPNPAESYITIQSERIIEMVQIYDFTGKVVYSTNGTNNTLVVPVSNLSNGIYFIKMESEGQTVTTKFVKR